MLYIEIIGRGVCFKRLEPKATSYTNWENTGLDGHTLGHYLSALSMYYASSKNKKAEELKKEK